MKIAGIGTATPEHDLNQRDAAEHVSFLRKDDPAEARRLAVLYRRSGVRRRGSAVLCFDADGSPRVPFLEDDPGTAARMDAYDRLAPPLAALAARRALESSATAASDVTHLVTASCTGFSAPGPDIALFSALGLSPTVERTHVGFMGCHGAQNAIRVAHALCRAHTDAKVLVVAVELTSLHFRIAPDPARAVSEAIFADGAGALVGVPGDGPWSVAGTGSCLIPQSSDAMTWRIGDHGFEMGLSPRVPDLLREHLRPWLTEWLRRGDLRLADVGTWAIHPGGPRILDAATEALGLPREVTDTSREVLAEHGNMSSPTILFVLERLRLRDAPLPLVALGFGPGLTAEALRID